jgi:hypothetical protein
MGSGVWDLARMASSGGSTVPTESEPSPPWSPRSSIFPFTAHRFDIAAIHFVYIPPFREVAMLRALIFSVLYHPSGAGGDGGRARI